MKPEVFREAIERISPDPRIELFARKRVIGWDAWGNEVDSDIDLCAKQRMDFRGTVWGMQYKSGTNGKKGNSRNETDSGS